MERLTIAEALEQLEIIKAYGCVDKLKRDEKALDMAIELLRADEQGRLAVLIRRPGELVYKIKQRTTLCYGNWRNCMLPVERCPYNYGLKYCHKDGNMEIVTEGFTVDDYDFATRSLKKGVHLTREAAEAALTANNDSTGG